MYLISLVVVYVISTDHRWILYLDEGKGSGMNKFNEKSLISIKSLLTLQL